MQLTASDYLAPATLYCLDDLPEARTGVSSTFAGLDEATRGGLHSGALWALVGARGAGITNLALQIGLNAAQETPVLFVNDHIRPASLRERCHALTSGNPGLLDAARKNLGFASWVPPSPDGHWRGDIAEPRLLILDTADDQNLPAWHRRARQQQTSIIVTYRQPATNHESSWATHPDYRTVMDEADVVLELTRQPASDDSHRMLTAVANREGPDWSHELFSHPARLCLTELHQDS